MGSSGDEEGTGPLGDPDPPTRPPRVDCPSPGIGGAHTSSPVNLGIDVRAHQSLTPFKGSRAGRDDTLQRRYLPLEVAYATGQLVTRVVVPVVRGRPQLRAVPGCLGPVPQRRQANCSPKFCPKI